MGVVFERRQGIRRIAPNFAPWVYLCYTMEKTLFLSEDTNPSISDIQQGNPLVPTLYTLARHDEFMYAKAQRSTS